MEVYMKSIIISWLVRYFLFSLYVLVHMILLLLELLAVMSDSILSIAGWSATCFACGGGFSGWKVLSSLSFNHCFCGKEGTICSIFISIISMIIVIFIILGFQVAIFHMSKINGLLCFKLIGIWQICANFLPDSRA